MTPDEYVELALRTENMNYYKITERVTEEQNIRLLHAFIGMSTETGELMDALKKYLIYGKDLDVANLEEELGDMLWYIALAISSIKKIKEPFHGSCSFDLIMSANIRKLAKRYGDKYTDVAAINRNYSDEFKAAHDFSLPANGDTE
jgi:NTP pyrophosphatase (non-canonical NTP hydrolase)